MTTEKNTSDPCLLSESDWDVIYYALADRLSSAHISNIMNKIGPAGRKSYHHFNNLQTTVVPALTKSLDIAIAERLDAVNDLRAAKDYAATLETLLREALTSLEDHASAAAKDYYALADRIRNDAPCIACGAPAPPAHNKGCARQ